MIFPDKFFKEEVRDDYLISEIMKKTWASQLTIFDALKRLMDKYDLKYFAECGTLLGAVRHHGYIPWDDDFDIGMLRKDYMTLLEHADEIGEGLTIRSIYNCDTYMNVHAVVTQKADSLKWDDDRLNDYHGCPFICYVDIFPWDNVPDDPKRKRLHKELYYSVYRLMFDIRDIEDRYFDKREITYNELCDFYKSSREDIAPIKKFLDNMAFCKRMMKKHLGIQDIIATSEVLLHQLALLSERVATMHNDEITQKVEYAPKLAIAEENRPREKSWLEETIELPFEFTCISVPKEYVKVCRNQYGEDFMSPVRFTSAHDFPFFRDEVRVLLGADTGDSCSIGSGVEPDPDAIPTEWKAFLLREDRTLKKIVICGLSATDILNNGTCSIESITSFLRRKKYEKDTLIIAFVPYALREFMKKCCLELYLKYMKLIEEVEQLHNVIWDEEENPAIIRAVASISDEYVGDRCNLSLLCESYGIPVTILQYQHQSNGIQKRVSLANLSFTNEYFFDEVRNGFFVPEMMKRFWAAQMVVLSEIDKVCRNHNINWFADMGSLIGAVRHRGFVPWDDDLDISMLRDDWEEFFKYARKELPEGYIVLTNDDYEEYDLALGRIVNGKAIDTGTEHMDRFCGCPYVTGVDIFPIDKIYPDEKKEADRKKRVKDIYAVYNLLVERGEFDGEVRSRISEVERGSHISLHRDKRILKQMQRLLDNAMKEYRGDAKEAAFIVPWALQDRMNNPCNYYTDCMEMPFENTMVRVPEHFHEILAGNYGDYLEIRKGEDAHEYPAYFEQENLLRDHLGHNPYRYTLDRSVLEKRITEAEGINKKATKAINKDIVLLPCRVSWWESMRPLYENAVEVGNGDVYVIPIPYYECDYKGNVGTARYELAEFMIDERFTTFDEYNIIERHPAKIVIQVPYDGESSSFTVPEQLYSDKLLNYTDELIYIPCFDVDDPESLESKALKNLQILVEQPVVINADKIVLKTDALKTFYIETLVMLAGEDTRDYWNKKIILINDMTW